LGDEQQFSNVDGSFGSVAYNTAIYS